MERHERNIDVKFQEVVARFSSRSSFFERCSKWYFKDAFDPKKLCITIKRYADKRFIPHWLRQIIYRGTYEQVLKEVPA